MLAVDEELFTATGWFALDAANTRVPRVRPGTLAAALALVGDGPVATVVGRLHTAVAGVDIDAAGASGDAVVAALTSWCRERGLWYLTRRSGGGPGRWHLFTIPGDHAPDLLQLLAELRTTHQLRGPALDLRQAIRPLSAPHRTGDPCPPTGLSTQTLTGLRRALAAAAADSAATEAPARGRGPTTPAVQLLERDEGTTPSPAAGRTPGAPVPAPRGQPDPVTSRESPAVVPARPRRRPRRELPARWEHYLRHGCLPDSAEPSTGTPMSGAVGAPGPAGVVDRSLVERHATYALVVAGHDESSAWTAITCSCPQAFTKARSRGRAWWCRHVWNDAVRAADDWLAAHPTASLNEHPDSQRHHVAAAVARVRAALAQEWLNWGYRERHSMRAIQEALLERMERTGLTTVPCPERDLLLDTPIASRSTARTGLHRLAEEGFGLLHATFTPAPRGTAPEDVEPDTRSHTWALAPRFLTDPDGSPVDQPEDPNAGEEALRLVDPPKSHAPPPPQSSTATSFVGLWRVHGLIARDVFHALESLPTALDVLAHRAGLVHDRDSAPTAAQLRTASWHLQTLASLGLAQVDAHGHWSRSSELDDQVRKDLSVSGQRAEHEAQERVAARVADERASYRHYRDRPCQSTWSQQRGIALARQAQHDAVRHRAWWDALDPQQRADRSARRARDFADAPVAAQAALKATWAQRRALAGHSEAQRHHAWLVSHTPTEYADRVATRTADYWAMPPPARAAAAAAWHAHRVRYDVPRGHPADVDLPRPPDPPPADPPSCSPGGLPQHLVNQRCEQLTLDNLEVPSALQLAP